MRAYFFGNMYISSIQQGIQAQHVTSELFTKYNLDSPLSAGATLYEWARNHKTSILLNGGYSSTLRGIIDLFNNSENPYPWTFFKESEDAADGLLTSVGIILPAKIYDTASEMRSNPEYVEEVRKYGVVPTDTGQEEISKWEFELCLELNKYGLAS